MTNEELAIPTRELLAGLREMYRQWLANGRRIDAPGRLPSTAVGNVAPICQAIEVTSSTADSYGYPARIQTWDGTNWSDTYEACRAVQIGSTIAGAVLATGFYPIGRLMYVTPTGLHVYGIHPGTGGTELKGLTFTSDTDSTADSDPGNGLFKWNNATQSSATVLYFDNQTADGIAINTLWSSLQAMGYIYLQQSDDSTKWQLWKRTVKPTNGTGYYKFPVTLVASNGSIADAKTVYCEFIGVPKCREYTYGTAITTGDVSLSGAWGANATVSAVTGNDEVGTIQVLTNAADTPTADPELTLTFKDGTWGSNPLAVACMAPSGSSPIAIVTTNCTATTMTLTYNGTPTPTTAANYNFVYHVRFPDSL